MKIVDKILDILNSMSDVETVLYESSFGVNIRLDRRPTPAAIVYLLQNFDIDLSSGLRKDYVDVEVFFCTRCDFAAKGEEIKGVMETLEPTVDEFVSRVLADKSMVLEGDKVSVTTAYGSFDCNVCGWSLQMKVGDKQGRCVGTEA